MSYIHALDLSLSSTGVCIFTNDGLFIKAKTIETFGIKETKLKLKYIGDEFKNLIKEYPPNLVLIEQGFTLFNTSTQAIFRVHGVVNYLFSDFEQVYYPATTIKKIVGGKGNMTKKEIKTIIYKKYPSISLANYDESDAFAIALTYFIEKGITVNVP